MKREYGLGRPSAITVRSCFDRILLLCHESILESDFTTRSVAKKSVRCLIFSPCDGLTISGEFQVDLLDARISIVNFNGESNTGWVERDALITKQRFPNRALGIEKQETIEFSTFNIDCNGFTSRIRYCHGAVGVRECTRLKGLGSGLWSSGIDNCGIIGIVASFVSIEIPRRLPLLPGLGAKCDLDAPDWVGGAACCYSLEVDLACTLSVVV